MSNFETQIMRDVSKMVLVIGISLIVVVAGLLVILHIVPSFVDHSRFIESNECLYFKELQKSLCGQEAIDYINDGSES